MRQWQVFARSGTLAVMMNVAPQNLESMDAQQLRELALSLMRTVGQQEHGLASVSRTAAHAALSTASICTGVRYPIAECRRTRL
ncbi:hypothetical protein H0A66_18120 [Alcaligenaceae bacterium]|nr:hypothetical protein [Alcaligenaceae bacterium]